MRENQHTAIGPMITLLWTGLIWARFTWRSSERERIRTAAPATPAEIYLANVALDWAEVVEQLGATPRTVGAGDWLFTREVDPASGLYQYRAQNVTSATPWRRDQMLPAGDMPSAWLMRVAGLKGLLTCEEFKQNRAHEGRVLH